MHDYVPARTYAPKMMEKIREAAQLRREGLTLKAVAKIQGCSVERVRQREIAARRIDQNMASLIARGWKSAFSARTHNCLYYELNTCDFTPAEVMAIPYEALVRIPNLGKKSVAEIIAKLGEVGLFYGPPTPPP